MSYRTW